MKWRKVDKGSLPEGLVLAGDLDEKELEIGVIRICGGSGRPVCNNGYHKYGLYPDHYIPVEELLALEKEN